MINFAADFNFLLTKQLIKMKLYKLAVALLCLAGTATAKAQTETVVPEFGNDGPQRNIFNYGENIIKNGSFEYEDAFEHWTNGIGGKLTSADFKIVTEGDNHYLQGTSNSDPKTAKSLSTVWSIDPGKTYVISYKVKASVEKKSTYHVVSLTNERGTEAKVITNKETPVTKNWTEIKYTFTNDENYAYVQFQARWLANNDSFDDFYLVEKIDEDIIEGNVDYATAAIPTANTGNGAFQYTSQPLQDATAKANALEQGKSTVEEVEAAYNALKNLPLNKPAEGQLFNVVNVSANYDHAGKTLTFKSASNADLTGNTTAMGWTEYPGSIYPQAVKLTAVEDELNTYTLSYTRADGKVVYASTGITSGVGTTAMQIRPTTDESKALKFYVEADLTKEGVWYLWNTECNYRLGGNGKDNSGFFTGESNGYAYYDIKLQEAVENTVALNIDAENQYGTLIVPFDTELPEGVEAYSVETANGNVLNLKAEESIKANTPYIVYAEEGSTAELTGLGAAYEDTEYTVGLLTGVYAEKTVPEGSYVLQNQDETGIGFYKVESKDIKVKANHAYLTAAKGSDVKGFFFGSDDATAVKGVEAAGEKAGVIYNLAGQRVEKAVKGIYIINGKKMLVK